MFKKHVTKIVTGMRVSTKFDGTTSKCSVARANVIECPTVKAVTNSITERHLFNG